MVLVHPQQRRRGVGRALVLHALEHLRNRGVRRVGLDATPAGRGVYETLGFKACQELTRWARPSTTTPPRIEPNVVAPTALRPLRPRDRSHLIAFDQAALGVARPELITALARGATDSLHLETGPCQTRAVGLTREGAQAQYIGPVFATTASDGQHILDALLVRCGSNPVYCDIPNANAAANDWARLRGFLPQRTLTRMFLGQPPRPAAPESLFAIAGPEIG